MTAEQIKAARRLLGWSRDRLAGMSGMPVQAVMSFERNEARPSMTGERLAAIRAALEAAGVEFIPENGGGPGVRLRQTASTPAAGSPS